MRSFEKTVQANAVHQDARLSEVLTQSKPEEPFTMLLLGDDRRPGEEDARADTIIVARVDPAQQKVWMISIPRDTRVEIPGHGVDKVNAANYYGGPSLTVETIEQFLGIPINHYMQLNFDGFQEVVDALGGIWIDVDVEIDDRKAASHSPGARAKHIDPGYQLLDGEHALTYVRSRDFPDADFTRMKHQQAFFKALAEQSTKIDNVLKIPSMVSRIAKHMSTDMSVKKLASLAMGLRGIGGDAVQTATVLGQWRSPYVWPDEANKQRLVSLMQSGEPFESTATVNPAVVVTPANVSVSVRNGAGISGVAGEAADIVKAAGFKVSEIGNANQFVYDRTLVVYKDKKGEAEAVLASLPAGDLVASRGMYSFTTDVLVVVGKDWRLTPSSGTSVAQ
jgi:LCP family protein required for cell wall assembly